ncbi:peptide chain release factor N(5)-glutamine methyltransferase [Salinithrix halophila]|uniref:Release factor glutamine methyltransferase n=1 Tax=Salinithrix halophila TaxID=1485204 RepID=A0ABV8JEF4_9BACL
MKKRQETTVLKAWREEAHRLVNAGVENGSFEVEVMLRSILGWERTRFFMEMDRPLDEETLHTLKDWVEKRKLGVPLQYLTGEQEFYGRSFCVGPQVLIPRPDTETLVEAVLQKAQAIWGEQPITVADIGTGSGILAVTLAAERPDWSLIAVDRSPSALAMAKRNAERHGVSSHIAFQEGDWLLPLIREGIHADLIISNPPYIPTPEVERLDREVREHEPRIALDGGVDGLTPYREILKQAPSVLNKPGVVAFEIGWDQGSAVTQMGSSLPGAAESTVLTDLAGRDRVVVMRVNR